MSGDGENLLPQDRTSNLEMWENFSATERTVFLESAIIKRQKCNYFGLFLCSGIFRTPYKHLPGGAHCTWHATVNQAVHSKWN